MSRRNRARKPASQNPTQKAVNSQSWGTHLPTTRAGINSSAEQQAEFISSIRESISVLFSRANSILTGKEIPVVFDYATSTSAPAWTDGESIFFHERSLPSATIVDELFGKGSPLPASPNKGKFVNRLIALRGLNYHELSHVLYTPRVKGSFLAAIQSIVFNGRPQLSPLFVQNSNDGFKMFNLLEDQRIESLFSTKYPASKPYFTRTFSTFILDPNECDISTVFLLAHGRKYLPADIRSIAEQNFQSTYKVSDSDMAQFKRLIDAFRHLSLPAQVSLAIGIITEFGNLVLKYIPDFFLTPTGGSYGNHTPTRKGTGESNREQNKVSDSEEFDEENDEDTSKGGGNADSDEESDEDTDETGDDDGDGDGEDSDDSKESEENKTSGTASTSGDSSTKQSDVQHDNPPANNRALVNAAHNAIDEVQEQLSDDIRKQIKTIREIAQKQRFKRFFDNTIAPVETVAPSSHFRALSNSIGSALAKLIADNDNQWDRNTDSGNLNVLAQKLSRGLHTDIFDQWVDEGNDDVSAEVVVLLDLSSSMEGHPTDWAKANRVVSENGGDVYRALGTSVRLETTLVKEASQAMWSLKHACQAHDIPCSVIGYSDSSYALFSAHDTVTNQAGVFGAYGNTVASGALNVAKSVFANSEAKYKLLVTITDGEIQDRTDAQTIVEELNKTGVQTVLIGLAGHHYDSTAWVEQKVLKPIYSVRKRIASDPANFFSDLKFQDVHTVPDCKALVKVIGKTLVKGVVSKI